MEYFLKPSKLPCLCDNIQNPYRKVIKYRLFKMLNNTGTGVVMRIVALKDKGLFPYILKIVQRYVFELLCMKNKPVPFVY